MGLRASRDRPARIDLVDEPALSEHVTEAAHHLSVGIFWRYPVGRDYRDLGPESEFPLGRNLKGGLEPHKRGIGVDLLRCTFRHARPRRRREAVEKFDLS